MTPSFVFSLSDAKLRKYFMRVLSVAGYNVSMGKNCQRDVMLLTMKTIRERGIYAADGSIFRIPYESEEEFLLNMTLLGK